MRTYLNRGIINKFILKKLNLCQDSKVRIVPIGGMTNKNYIVITDIIKMVIRLPGVATEYLINRDHEKINSELAYLIGINTRTVYFDNITGIKITVYIPDAEKITSDIARRNSSIRKISQCFRKLHQSEIKFCNVFNHVHEYQKYISMLNNVNIFSDFSYRDDIFCFFNKTRDILEKLGGNLCPCHNDLVAENIIKSKERIYLIDWEYSGMNDPMWDLASHFLECKFTPDEEEFFLFSYFGKKVSKVAEQKILLFKFTQDVLWAVWTKVKEQNGDNFGDYGINRFKNAYQLMCNYKKIYEN